MELSCVDTWERCEQVDECGPDPESSPPEVEGVGDDREHVPAIDNVLSAYLEDLGRYPLLSAKDEAELGGQIQECQAKVMELRRKLSLALRETDRADAVIRADEKRRSTSSAPGDVLSETVPRSLAKAGERFPKDKNLQALLGRIEREQFRLCTLYDRMTLSNLRLVISVSKTFVNRGLPLADLIQEGNVGLMKAVTRFDPGKGARFSTYAIWWIQQAIRRSIERQGRTIRLPSHILGALNRYRRTGGSLVEGTGELSSEGMMEAARLSPSQFGALRNHLEGPISLETPLENNRESLIDLLPDRNGPTSLEIVMQRDLYEKLQGTLAKVLSPREGKILKQRFGIGFKKECTLEDIARELGISRERVRQIEKRALEKLKSAEKEKWFEELRGFAK